MPPQIKTKMLYSVIDTLIELAGEEGQLDDFLAVRTELVSMGGKKTSIEAAAARLAASSHGTGAVTGTNVSTTITHAYGSTPRADQIKIIPTNAFMAANGYFITAIGATTFVVNIPTAAGEGNTADFAWEVL